MKIPVLSTVVDERFLQHRLRSSSLGGIAGGCLALGLFGYRFYVDHQWSSDLLAVGVTMVVVKLSALTWYRLTD